MAEHMVEAVRELLWLRQLSSVLRCRHASSPELYANITLAAEVKLFGSRHRAPVFAWRQLVADKLASVVILAQLVIQVDLKIGP